MVKWGSSRNAWSSFWDCMRSQPRAYGSGLLEKPLWLIMWWVYATDHMMKKKQVKQDNWKKPQVHRAWCSQGSWTTSISARRQHVRAQGTQGISGVHWWQLPVTGDWGVNDEWYSPKPDTYKQEQVGVSLSCTNWDTEEFRNLRAGSKATRRITILSFRRVNFVLFRDLIWRIPGENVLERWMVQESWLIFKDCHLQAQEWSIPVSRISSRCSRKLAWMNK